LNPEPPDCEAYWSHATFGETKFKLRINLSNQILSKDIKWFGTCSIGGLTTND